MPRRGTGKKPPPAVELIPAPTPPQRVPRHHYTLQDIFLFLRLVLFGRTTLRCAERVPAVVSEVCGLSLGQPVWSTGRLWLLRLGLYKLQRPKVIADDWVLLLDYTVQAGTTKCLLILGVRLSELPPAGQSLQHADLEPIALVPVEHSTQQAVCEQLERVVDKIGVPRAILTDHGSDVQGGIKLFQSRHPQTLEIYDVTHKAARVLKRHLERDAQWAEFGRQVGQARRQLQQTSLASLLPPPIGEKARFMNLGPLIRWGMETLRVLDQRPSAVPAPLLEQRLGWLRQFAESLKKWSEYMAVIDLTVEFVRDEGHTPQSAAQLREMLDALCLSPEPRTLAIELAAFVREQASQAAPGERLPGSTEVLESCFGTFKALEQHQSRGGFTSLILSLGALVSKTTTEIVSKALEAVRTKDVWTWCRTNLGQSVQSLRQQIYQHLPPNPETKPG